MARNTASKLLLVFLALLALSVGIVFTISDAKTKNVTFTYQRATEREDGSRLSLEEIKYTRLYCGGLQLAQEAGADGDISPELPAGSHGCYGTHVDANGVESGPSRTVTVFFEL